MKQARAHAKINLALVVGPLRKDGKHEVATVLQAVELHDDVALERAPRSSVEGFAQDTLVRAALEGLARTTPESAAWRVRITKRIPVAAGLGGGSSDAAAALRLANAGLGSPLPSEELHRLAAIVGADVPFFLRGGAQLATGFGGDLAPLALPDDYAVLVLVPRDARKGSTAAVYRAFDERDGAAGFESRKLALERALVGIGSPGDLARLPTNDLASSPSAGALEDLGAFRADVTGAGPAVYGLFETRAAASAAAHEAAPLGDTFVTAPVARR